MKMRIDLKQGNVTKSMLLFSLPLIAGNLLQQLYNIVDTLIVGRFVGAGALAAVGSSFTLMVFLTSIILGLCMGSGAVISQLYGGGYEDEVKRTVFNAFILIGLLSVMIFIAAYAGMEPFMRLLNIQPEVWQDTRAYLRIVLVGILFTFLYNFFAAVLRSVGDSIGPLVFLGISAALNIILDLWLVLGMDMGVSGAAIATVIAQAVSAAGIGLYFYKKGAAVCPERRHMCFSLTVIKSVAGNSILSSFQQSIMNFGILLVQGLINSFGVAAMAGFAAAAKIDSFAYMPAQDFGNGFSTFVAQNYGAGNKKRLEEGMKQAVKIVFLFCLVISILVFTGAEQLMTFFVKKENTDVIAVGVEYLRIEGVFYCLIGFLFLFYGFYRGRGKPEMSLILTIISLGTRVVLAYSLAAVPSIGLNGVWWAVPIGWLLADTVGILRYIQLRKQSD